MKAKQSKKLPKVFFQVGNGKFEAAVKELDRLVGEKKLKAEVTIQLGLGDYKPKHCKWFKFESPLTKYHEWADLIISHGGPGSVFEVLRMEKKLIALPNRNRTDPNHQVEYLRAMDKETDSFIYCDRVDLLEDCLNRTKTHKFTKYVPSGCKMNEVIGQFLRVK